MRATVDRAGRGRRRRSRRSARELAAGARHARGGHARGSSSTASADPVEALSAATPYQRLFATVVAGWLMARSALAAQSVLDRGTGDQSFLEAKVVTARFFAEQLLPQVHGLLGPVRAGKDDLMALAPTDF